MSYNYNEDVLAYKTGAKKQYQGANVKFEYVEVLDPKATEKAGVKQYKQVERCIVHFPGGDERVVEVTDRILAEYGHLYEKFKSGSEQPPDGMPLKMWPAIDGAGAKNLAQFKIYTVEQLAELSGEMRRKIGHLDKWVKVAKEYLANADTPQAEVTNMKRQLTNSKKKIKELEEQLHLALVRIDSLEGTNISGA